MHHPIKNQIDDEAPHDVSLGRFRYAIVDVDTSEFYGRLAQISAIKLDLQYNEVTSFTRFVQPNGWVMGARMSNKNSLTRAFLEANGEDIRLAVADYIQLIDEGYTVTGYNVDYDMQIMEDEVRRMGLPMPHIRYFCMMKAMIPVCRIPKQAGFKGFRNPTLDQALVFFGLERVKSAILGQNDVRNKLILFKKMLSVGKVIVPRIKFSVDS